MTTNANNEVDQRFDVEFQMSDEPMEFPLKAGTIVLEDYGSSGQHLDAVEGQCSSVSELLFFGDAFGVPSLK